MPRTPPTWGCACHDHRRHPHRAPAHPDHRTRYRGAARREPRHDDPVGEPRSRRGASNLGSGDVGGAERVARNRVTRRRSGSRTHCPRLDRRRRRRTADCHTGGNRKCSNRTRGPTAARAGRFVRACGYRDGSRAVDVSRPGGHRAGRSRPCAARAVDRVACTGRPRRRHQSDERTRPPRSAGAGRLAARREHNVADKQGRSGHSPRRFGRLRTE